VEVYSRRPHSHHAYTAAFHGTSGLLGLAIVALLSRWLKYMAYIVLRYIIVVFSFVQRLPMALLLIVGASFFWVLFKLTTLHRPLIYFVKTCLRLHFFLNGISIRKTGPWPKTFDQQVILANYIRPIDRAILFILLPYRKLVFLPEFFFDRNRLKWMFYALGFYPAESNFDIRTYEKKTFRAEAFVDSGFALAECVDVMHQYIEPVPYTFMIALKKKLNILCLQIKGSEHSPYATFFTPKRITVSVLDKIHPSHRREITVLHYQNVIKKYKEYEKNPAGA